MFRKASKSQARLRMALVGPAKSGKTFTALSIGRHLGGRVVGIDTEHGSMEKYADKFDFDVVQLAVFDPRNYIEMIKAAESEGYDVLVIDSLSHAWMGKGGVLEIADKAAKQSRSGNSFAAWKEASPIHASLIEAIIQSRCHIIATMRSKTEYVIESDPRTGKMAPRKVGLAPVQRNEMEFEFDIIGEMTPEHDMLIGGSRCEVLDNQVFNKPGKDVAQILIDWLSDGKRPNEPFQSPPQAAQVTAAPAQRIGLVSPDITTRLIEARDQLAMSEQQWISALSRRGVSEVSQLSANDADALLNNLMAHVMKKQADERAAQDGAAGGKDQYPFEAAAKPEDVAAHQAELPSQAVPDQTSDRRNEQPKDQAAAGSATETPAAESSSAEDFTLPDVPRPEKPEKPGRKSSKTKASTAAVESKEPETVGTAAEAS
jgi:hypothetical protein